MIKFWAKGKDGKPDLIVLGISEGNVEKLKQGMPIHVRGADIDMPNTDVLLMYGKTERDMYDELKKAGITIEHATLDMKSMKK